MLRFSDDEMPNQEGQSKKADGTTKSSSDKKSGEGGDILHNKPNFVYIVSMRLSHSSITHWLDAICQLNVFCFFSLA